ncbi:MAG: hypothetical protein KAV87_02400 [Desulfobacteraceae bacterium]|nr:hypothetical protein [Desulfobacteraceae bacterium]
MATDLHDTSGMTDEQREAHWRAMDDARTLAQAEIIKNDPDRLKAAVEKADLIAEEKIEEARSMSKVAGTLFDKTNNEEK